MMPRRGSVRVVILMTKARRQQQNRGEGGTAVLVRSLNWGLPMRLTLLILVAAAFAGCAGQMIKEGMQGLVGQPLSAAVSKLGVPTEERTIANMKLYIWSTDTVVKGTSSKCTIRAIMKGEVIGSFDFEGDEDQCSRYARMLTDSRPDSKPLLRRLLSTE
jgi:hypothetical protein